MPVQQFSLIVSMDSVENVNFLTFFGGSMCMLRSDGSWSAGQCLDDAYITVHGRAMARGKRSIRYEDLQGLKGFQAEKRRRAASAFLMVSGERQ